MFLPKPPKEELPIPFFRTEKGDKTKVSLNVYDTILLIQRRQEWLKEHLSDSGFEPLDFVGSHNANSTVSDIVNDIRNTLGLDENWAQRFQLGKKL